MPEKLECIYCGRKNEPDSINCRFCGGELSDAHREAYCDWCGIPLGKGREPAGKCVVCSAVVFLCEKHMRKATKDEIYCKNHESECFIATAVIGTPLDSRIDLLRQFRDERMKCGDLGSHMIRVYYEYSPYVAKHARCNPLLKRALRKFVVNPWLVLARASLPKKQAMTND